MAFNFESPIAGAGSGETKEWPKPETIQIDTTDAKIKLDPIRPYTASEQHPLLGRNLSGR